jgi:hypothetical protein
MSAKVGKMEFKKKIASTLMFFGVSLMVGTAGAQISPLQTLDRVGVSATDQMSGDAAFLDMKFDDVERPPDFEALPITGADFKSCKLTGGKGLFCLDDRLIKQWSNPLDPASEKTLIDTADPALDLDLRKETATALTVALDGTIWFAGKTRKGPTFVLYKARKKPAEEVCPTADGYFELDGTANTDDGDYCAKLVDSDKPLILDLNSVDGDVAANFPLGAGVLYVEDRKTLVFQPGDDSSRTVIASGNKALNFVGGEKELLSVALWQSVDGTENQVIMTTDKGRILAIEVFPDGSFGPTVEAFDIVAGRSDRSASDPVASQCDFESDPFFAVRASSKTGFVYLNDKTFCEVLALELDTSDTEQFGLTNVQEAGSDLTLSTASGSYAPGAPTVAPGISIDLNACVGTCPLLFDDGDIIYSLSGVRLATATTPSGLTLFQVKGLPDCRFIPQTCIDLFGVTDGADRAADIDNLIAAGFIDLRDPAVPYNPANQRLNMTKLLPLEIKEAVAPFVIPPLLLESLYNAQDDAPIPYIFEAFFGRTEDGVVFTSTFEEFYDVFGLVGGQRGCPFSPGETPPAPGGYEALLAGWDVATTVSERYESPKAPGEGPQYVASLTNSECGSIRSRASTWSLKPYNLGVTPCTFNATSDPRWEGDGYCVVEPAGVGETEVVDDAVFGKLLLELYDELGGTIDQFVCPTTGPPLASPSDCSSLQSRYQNALQKLDGCWGASQQPKSSSGAQNCQSFVSQLTALQSQALALPPNPADTANRIGEVQARIDRLFHVYDFFELSIPDDGFCEPDNPDYFEDYMGVDSDQICNGPPPSP